MWRLSGPRWAFVAVITVTLGISGFAATPAGASVRPAAPQGTPLVVGWVGTETGAPGTSGSSTMGRDAFDAWVKWMNTHGGINGHPVKAYYADDKGDPAVLLSAVKDLTENKKVVAILGQAAANIVTVAPYIKDNNLPVIGGNQSDPSYLSNPLFYAVGGTVTSTLWGQMNAAAKQGVKRVGVLLCTEYAACEGARAIFRAQAEANGLKEVYDAVASTTQPSYTAECIAAKDKGAQALAAFVNTTVMSRDCTRQNYKPKWINADYLPLRDTIDQAPVLGNTVGASEHWNCMGDPLNNGTKVFWTAMDKYYPEYMKGGKKYGQQAITLCSGWDAGMAFKKAIENANVAATATATRQDVIKGLSMFRGETLDGFSTPLTFGDGTAPNPEQKCTFTYQWKGTTMVRLPKDGSPVCKP